MKAYQKVPILAGGNYSMKMVAQGLPGTPHIAVIDTIETSGWRSWDLPPGCVALTMQRRTTGSVKLALSASDSADYIAFSDTKPIKVDQMFAVGTTLYFQAVSSACEVEILYWMQGNVPHTAAGYSSSSSSSSSRSSSSSSRSSSSSSSSSSKSSSSSSLSSSSSSSSSSLSSSSSSSSSSLSSSSSSSSSSLSSSSSSSSSLSSSSSSSSSSLSSSSSSAAP